MLPLSPPYSGVHEHLDLLLRISSLIKFFFLIIMDSIAALRSSDVLLLTHIYQKYDSILEDGAAMLPR